VFSSIALIQNLADRAKGESAANSVALESSGGEDKITIDKNSLQNLLAQLTSKVSMLGQLGNDWGNMCEGMNETLALTHDKSVTLKKKVEVLTIERNKVQRR
jgi:hypothetical protein